MNENVKRFASGNTPRSSQYVLDEDTRRFVEGQSHLAFTFANLVSKRYSRLLTADEVLSASFSGLMRAARKHRLLPTSHFARMAGRVMMNRVRSEAKKQQRRRQRECRLSDEVTESVAAPAREQHSQLDDLPELERRIVGQIVEGLTWSEICERNGITQHALSYSVRRIKWLIAGNQAGKEKIEYRRVA